MWELTSVPSGCPPTPHPHASVVTGLVLVSMWIGPSLFASIKHNVQFSIQSEVGGREVSLHVEVEGCEPVCVWVCMSVCTVCV